MDHSSVIGLDISKRVFHLCEMTKRGRVKLRKRLNRGQVLWYFASRERSLVAIESCGGSSYWARELKRLGYSVRLIPAQHVKPFVKSQKNDSVDAEAICEAALRPQMRFVSPNTVEQQDLQNVHRVRERLVKQRTSLSNQIRGLLLEYGITIPVGVEKVAPTLCSLLSSPVEAERKLWQIVFAQLYEELCLLNEKLRSYDKLLRRLSREHPVCRRLEQIPGVGPITATAVVAAVGNPFDFRNGRQFSAWLGLVPQQYSTGGKTILRGITKKGNRYIRKLLVHGARNEARLAKRREYEWFVELKQRRGYNRAAVALANKNARRIWALLAYEENYRPAKAA